MRERDYLDTLLHPADGSAHTGPSTFDSHDSELLGYLLLALLTVIGLLYAALGIHPSL